MDISESKHKQAPIVAVDMFCGVGGLTYGLQQAGINVIAGVDVDPTCQYAFVKNNDAKFIEKDIRDFTGKDLSKRYPADGIKALVGCAPCQPFSVHTRKYKNRPRDQRWDLLNDFGRLIMAVKPEIVAFENVPPIRNEQIFSDFTHKLDSSGYQTWSDLVYCPNYGIPQKRRRLVLIASRLGKVAFLPKTHAHSPSGDLEPYTTVRQTIKNLPPIRSGEESPDDPMHRARALSELNIKRIEQSKPGGTWEDWDEELRAPCHQKPSGQTYKSVYGRMEWDKPSPTITTQFHNFGSGRYGHPEQDRALSFREGALLQTFPSDYDFAPPDAAIVAKRVCAYIGNAVPVLLAKAIGETIQKHVEENL